jgi:hypothetical protein
MAKLRQPKAIIYPSTRRHAKTKVRQKGFRYKLIGLNGENLGPSQFYTRKESAIKTCAGYFPNFKIVNKA